MHITSVDNFHLTSYRTTATSLRNPGANMKPKSLSSRLFGRNSAIAAADTLGTGASQYQRHVDSSEDSSSVDSEPAADTSVQRERCHRDVHFAFLPDRYEQLTDDEAKEEKKKRKKEKYKKVKKNVGKALRSTWKCLMLGLYNLALGYSTPITVAATFVPDFHKGRG